MIYIYHWYSMTILWTSPVKIPWSHENLHHEHMAFSRWKPCEASCLEPSHGLKWIVPQKTSTYRMIFSHLKYIYHHFNRYLSAISDLDFTNFYLFCRCYKATGWDSNLDLSFHFINPQLDQTWMVASIIGWARGQHVPSDGISTMASIFGRFRGQLSQLAAKDHHQPFLANSQVTTERFGDEGAVAVAGAAGSVAGFDEGRTCSGFRARSCFSCWTMLSLNRFLWSERNGQRRFKSHELVIFCRAWTSLIEGGLGLLTR